MARTNPISSVQIYSLFIKHFQGLLSPSTASEIDKVLNECKSCRIMYNEIADFFDDDDALLYETMNREEVEQFRKNAQTQMMKQLDLSETSQQNYSVNINDYNTLHCCGS